MEEKEFNYDKKDLEFLEAEEQRLQFAQFTEAEMLRLAEAIVHQAKKYEPEKIAFQITRLRDNCVAFQFVSDEKAERNILFAQGKRNACIHEGHSSFHAFVRGHVEGNADALFTRGLEEIPAAGAYPIRVKDEIVAVLGVSGLHQGNDHRLIVEALCEVLNQEYIPFEKEIA